MLYSAVNQAPACQEKHSPVKSRFIITVWIEESFSALLTSHAVQLTKTLYVTSMVISGMI